MSGTPLNFEKCSIIRGWRLRFTHDVVARCAMPRDAFRSAFSEAAREAAYEPPRKLVALNVVEFLSREIPPREMLLTPILPTQGLVMLYSWRGVVKHIRPLGSRSPSLLAGPSCAGRHLSRGGCSTSMVKCRPV